MVNGIACARRVKKLYRGGRYFLCCHCCGLTYASRNEDRWGRALRRANAIRTKLGGEPGVTAPVPDRPKGMWSRTYARLVRGIDEAESRAEERLVIVAARLMARAQKPRRCARTGFWR